jgi:hypothetical protein
MANVKDGDDFAAFEGLLNAAYRYTDGHKAGLSEEELDGLRQELAQILEEMDDRAESGK